MHLRDLMHLQTRNPFAGFSESQTHLSTFVLWALVLHALAYGWLSTLDFSKMLDSANAPTLREIEIFSDSRPIVQSAPYDDGSNQRAEFRSDRRNRVKDQTRSTRLGPHSESFFREKTPEVAESEEGLLRSVPRALSLRDLVQLSQTPYKLDDTIREGDETILNTDSVSYASFLHRISDAIYPAWVSNLREAATDLSVSENASALRQSVYITRVGVEMDTDGNLISVQVIQSSGVRQFDDAPRSAFWEKEPFRNPPRQLFAENQNTVRFTYEFHFQLKNSWFSILPSLPL